MIALMALATAVGGAVVTGGPFGATPTKRRFTGQVLDEVAGGLYFYNARYYDPALGRFISGYDRA
ncbi:RHS repeat-associated core domain-containing protein [Candidatus Amarolinea dominans]|uniref:RHS repeat-associated core domain-containing protein n=1 Tax=Candidatus Amarolinea dominans TaxID=3140696 RepID=UPI0031CC98BA